MDLDVLAHSTLKEIRLIKYAIYLRGQLYLKQKYLKLTYLKLSPTGFILLIKGVLLFWKFSYQKWMWYKKLIVRLDILDMAVGIEGMYFFLESI